MNNVIMDSQILTTLMACPRKCDYTFNLNLVPKGGISNSFECGLLAHFILDTYNKAIMSGKSKSEAITEGFEAGIEYINPFRAANKYIRDSTHTGMTNTPEHSTKEKLASGGYREIIGWSYVLDTMKQYFDFYVNDHWTIVGSEVVKGEVLYEDSDIRILWKAKFDQIVDREDGFASIDHKTSKRREDTLSLNNQFMGQCILLKSRYVIINKIGWQTTLPAEQKFTRVVINYSADRLAEWQYEILPHYARMYLAYQESIIDDNGARIENASFPPQFTSCRTKYGNCQYLEVCQVDRNLRDETIKANFDVGKKWDISNDED